MGVSLMRAFIGIDFDRKLKNEIADLQQRLKCYAQKGRWKYVDNFHLTLKFLDEINATQRAQIDAAMKQVCAGCKPFNLTVTGLGIFNGQDSIRVLWLGLAGDLRELQHLHKEIDAVLAPIGFPPERRRFTPHVTLGQDIVFDCDFDQVREAIGEVRFTMPPVDRLFLFKSEQVQQKRIYSKVTEYKLALSDMPE